MASGTCLLFEVDLLALRSPDFLEDSSRLFVRRRFLDLRIELESELSLEFEDNFRRSRLLVPLSDLNERLALRLASLPVVKLPLLLLELPLYEELLPLLQVLVRLPRRPDERLECDDEQDDPEVDPVDEDLEHEWLSDCAEGLTDRIRGDTPFSL